jgi:hypothetical protein
VPTCTRQIPLGKLMCRLDWAWVPRAIRQAVYAAYRERLKHPAAYEQAVAAAVRAVTNAKTTQEPR